jgi:hypothetical protein
MSLSAPVAIQSTRPLTTVAGQQAVGIPPFFLMPNFDVAKFNERVSADSSFLCLQNTPPIVLSMV